MTELVFEFDWSDHKTKRSGRLSVSVKDDGTQSFIDLEDEAFEKAHSRVESLLGNDEFDMVSL